MPLSPVPGLIGRPDVLLDRAKAADRSGRREEAIKLYQRVLTLDPTNASVMCLLGIALAETGDPANAIRQFENGLRIEPEEAALWLNRGGALSSLGYNDEAITSFDRVIALRPNNEVGYIQRAGTLWRMGRFEDAAAAFVEGAFKQQRRRGRHFHLWLISRRLQRFSPLQQSLVQFRGAFHGLTQHRLG